MEWDPAQLRALSAAVSEGTFEAAARALHVTPSAISQRIKALETSVGRVLLVRTKPGAVVVLDNLSPHRAPAVRERLEAAGLELLLLPRYSPDLNPIEAMWSKVKEALRAAAARTVEALEAALATALARITADDARGFFRGCGYAAPAN